MSSERFYASAAEQFQGVFTIGFGNELPPLPGDFYAERDISTRGLTLDLGDVLNLRQEDNRDKMLPLTSSNSCQDFEDRHTAPPLSDEVRSFLGHTAMQLREYSAVAVGNRLLAFLRRDVDAQVQKVNQTKFTLKAVVFRYGLWCKIKVRIYQNDQGILVEFQRCSGDTLAFHRLYHQVSEHLLVPSSIQTMIRNPQEIQCVEALPADRQITPLLDMLDSCQNVNLLAEAASALNAFSIDPEVAKELRMPCAFTVLQHLRQVEDFRVAFPASCLLAAM